LRDLATVTGGRMVRP